MNTELKVDSGITPELRQQQTKRQFCDVILKAKGGETFSAHKAVLAARSDFFSQMFLSTFKDSKDEVSLQDEGSMVEEILRYIYCGTIKINSSNPQEILRLTDFYQLKNAFSAVERYICENLGADNSIGFLQVANLMGAKKLRAGCLKFMAENAERVSGFERLSAADLIEMTNNPKITWKPFGKKVVGWLKSIKSSNPDAASQVLSVLDFSELEPAEIISISEMFSKYTVTRLLTLVEKRNKVIDSLREGYIEAVYRFTIAQIRKVLAKEEIVYSPQFFVRNLPWRIRAERSESTANNKTRLLFELHLMCDGNIKSPNWRCHADYELRIISQKEEIPNLVKVGKAMFSSQSNCWGYDDVIQWCDLLNPQKGFLKDDAVILEVWLKPQAPTGMNCN